MKCFAHLMMKPYACLFHYFLTGMHTYITSFTIHTHPYPGILFRFWQEKPLPTHPTPEMAPTMTGFYLLLSYLTRLRWSLKTCRRPFQRFPTALRIKHIQLQPHLGPAYYARWPRELQRASGARGGWFGSLSWEIGEVFGVKTNPCISV